MKKLHYPLLDTLCLEERANLTMEVDEILAAGFNLPRQKNFSNVDLWNIHRQRKMNGQRRNLF
jgi:hypothetical protein